jgi:hypothetical protein
MIEVAKYASWLEHGKDLRIKSLFAIIRQVMYCQARYHHIKAPQVRERRVQIVVDDRN